MSPATCILALSAAGFASLNAPASISAAKPKPECAAVLAGTLWPDEANRDTKALRVAAQAGTLELCGIHPDGYHWQSISVNVSQLRAAPNSLEPADSVRGGSNDDLGSAEKHTNSDRSRGLFHKIRWVFGW